MTSVFTKAPIPLGRRGNPRTRSTRAKDTSARPFRVWDGEGISDKPVQCTCTVPMAPCPVRQNYVLFGWAQLDTGHEYISTTEPDTRLGTEQILDFIISQYDNDVWNVWFGSTYDVDQILRDLDDEELSHLRNSESNSIEWRGYRIMYIPGKRLEIVYDHKRVRIDDVVSFFRQSLVKVCKEYLVPDKCPGWELIALIEKDKDDRGKFTYSEIAGRITDYWKIEGDLMCHLMNQFRSALIAGGINLKSWLGPGAIANYVLDANGMGVHIRESWDTMPYELKVATSYAYFGGRFESRCIGDITQPVYVYDICSAYTTAMSRMPKLENGHWEHNTNRRIAMNRNINVWALYRYKAKKSDRYNVTTPLGAFPYRTSSGGYVRFGITGDGWLYGHEISAGLLAGARIEILESWEWVYNEHTVQRAAFDFLTVMYQKRKEYKAAGNAAQYGLKIGMSSLYGKVAQLVGYTRATPTTPFREPAKHHAWYAGQATSWCRAQIYRAALQAPESIVAIETDGIYSLTPLELDIGKELGQWEAEIYDHMVYVQSGIYWYKKQGHSEWEPAKARGLGAGTRGMTGDAAVVAAQGLEPMTTTVRRYGAFTGYRGTPRHGVWFEDERTINFDPRQSGKRVHMPMDCSPLRTPTHDEMAAACTGCAGTTTHHITHPSIPFPMFMSSPRPLPWDKDTMRLAQYLVLQNQLPDDPFTEYDPTDDWEGFY